MSPTILFVLISDGIRSIVGKIAASDYNLWCEGKLKVVSMGDPKVFATQQIQPGPPQIMLMPIIPLKVKQELFDIKPASIMVLGEINSDDKCTCNFYEDYKSILSKWKADLSGLVTPTKEDVSRIHAGTNH